MVLEVKHWGIDYFTCYASDKIKQDMLWTLGESIVKEEVGFGNLLHPFNVKGFQGFRAGSAFVGVRTDGVLASVSGGLAHDYVVSLHEACDSVSRLDLQATFRCPGGAPTWIRRANKAAVARVKHWKKKPEIDLRCNHSTPATLSINKPQSDRYFLCYDKGRETGLPELEDFARAELRLRGRATRGPLVPLAASGFAWPQVAGSLQKFARNCGVPLAFAGAHPTSSRCPSKIVDRERLLAWRQRCSGPSIRRDIERFGLQTMLDCLGLNDYVIPKQTM